MGLADQHNVQENGCVGLGFCESPLSWNAKTCDRVDLGSQEDTKASELAVQGL